MAANQPEEKEVELPTMQLPMQPIALPNLLAQPITAIATILVAEATASTPAALQTTPIT